MEDADTGRHHSQSDDDTTLLYPAQEYAPAADWDAQQAQGDVDAHLPGPRPPAAVLAPPQQQRPAQWGQPAGAPQWGAAPATQAPQAAPRRAPEPAAVRRPQPTAQLPAVSAQQRPAPPRRSEPRQPEHVDHYRRSGAPMQAAYAGIQQELLETAGDDRTQVATTGWRGAANAMGLKLAPGTKERKRREVWRRIRAPKDAMYSIAVLTLKGGAGKTTVTAALGQVFSSVRSDGVIAVDADPDAGDLARRTAVHDHDLSMVDLLEAEDLSQRDFVSRYLSTTDADLQVLASGWRPDSDRILVPEDIADIHEIASHYYSMLLWDGDKALNSPLVRTVLEKSNALVLLVEASVPGAAKAGQAIDWLRFHGFEGLLARTVVLVNETTANTRLDLEALMAVLARQQLKLAHIPYDKHLDEGQAIDLAKLSKKTRHALEDLAAMLADDFVIPQPPAPYAAAS